MSSSADPLNATSSSLIVKGKLTFFTYNNTVRLILKGQCHEIFCFWFFSWIIFSRASDYNIRAVSNCFQNSRRYSQLKVCHRCQRHRWYRLCTFTCKYLREFSKKFENGLNGILWSWGETDSWKKPEAKISWHCPFKYIQYVSIVLYFLLLRKTYQKFSCRSLVRKIWVFYHPPPSPTYFGI
jgi:hypothetical protein